MSSPKQKLLILIIALGFFALPLTAGAGILDSLSSNCLDRGNCGLCDIIGVAINIFRWILGLLAGAALLLFVWHGFGWISSAGNKEKIEASRKALVHTVIGLLIILGSWLIVNLIIVLLTTKPGAERPVVGTLFNSQQAWNEYCKGQ